MFDDHERAHRVSSPGEGNETPHEEVQPVHPLLGGLCEVGEAVRVPATAERVAQNPLGQRQMNEAHFGRE